MTINASSGSVHFADTTPCTIRSLAPGNENWRSHRVTCPTYARISLPSPIPSPAPDPSAGHPYSTPLAYLPRCPPSPAFPSARLTPLHRSPPRHPPPDIPHPFPTPYPMLIKYPHPITSSPIPLFLPVSMYCFCTVSLPSSTLDSSPTTFSREVSFHPAVTDPARFRFSIGNTGRFCPHHRIFIHRPPRLFPTTRP